MPPKKSVAVANPCFDCGKNTEDGIDCDNCKKWFCLICINRYVKDTISPQFYAKLQELSSFPWLCHHCSDVLLPSQLVQGKLFSDSELLALGVNLLSLTYKINRFSGGEGSENLVNPPTNTVDLAAESAIIAGGSNADVQELVKLMMTQQNNFATFMESQRKAQAQQDELLQKFMQTTLSSISQRQSNASLEHSQPAVALTAPTSASLLSTDLSGFQFQSGGIQNAPTNPVESAQGFSNSMGVRTDTEILFPRLPKFTLPEFYGEEEKFAGWWESFNANVHARDIDQRYKWDYLLSVVKGNAYRKIEGLGNSSANYNEAIEILKSIYGQGHLLKLRLWKALDQLKPVRADYSNLEEFTDMVRSKTTALKQLGVDTYTLDEYTALLYTKLPQNLQCEMEKLMVFMEQVNPDAAQKGWTLSHFISTLVRFQRIGASNSKAKPAEVKTESSPNQGTGANVTSTLFQSSDQQSKKPLKFNKPASKVTCIFCNGSHYSDACRKVSDVKQRREIVRQKQVCFKCLMPGHIIKDCKRNKKCFFCGSASHHSCFCMRKTGEHSKESKPTNPVRKTFEKKGDSSSDDSAQKSKQLYKNQIDCPGPPVMATMPAVIVNSITGDEIETIVYLDGGAQTTSIQEELANQLCLLPSEEITVGIASYGETAYKNHQSSRVHFLFKGPSGHFMKMSAWTVPSICPPLEIQPVATSTEVQAAIDKFQVVNKPPVQSQTVIVGLLIGQEYYNSIMSPPGGQIQCLEGSLRIHQTPFGSILSGCSTESVCVSKKKSRIMKVLMCVTDKDMKQVNQEECIGIDHEVSETAKIWSTETIGIKAAEKVDDTVDDYFKSTVSQPNEAKGRYQVRLPYRSSDPIISSNKNVALRRLQFIIEKKLCPDGIATEQLHKYDLIFQDQLHRGMIEKVNWNQPKLGPVLHYVSHFPVFKESTTTNVRIVIDPSTKTKEGVALNDLIYVGRNMMEDLAGLVMRFREEKIVLMADIEKAFLSISLHPEDRDAVRFLWLKNPKCLSLKDNVQIYRYTRIPFGVVSSPYLLHATINHHLEMNPGFIADKLKNQIYMDNALLGASSKEECLQIYTGIKELFGRVFMNFREWVSNCAFFNEQLPEADRMIVTENQVKVLGLNWNIAKDTLSPRVKLEEISNFTKRQVLHFIAKTFDPLGLVSPVTIKGRILLQDLWKDQLGWDAIMSSELQKEWNAIHKELQQLSHLQIQRRVLKDLKAPAKLLCCTDASPKAYAAAVYICQGEEVNLVFAKARVAPLKPNLTLPRLELMGILIGVRAMKFVESQIKVNISDKYLWSDSQIAICQVQSQKTQNTWIQNRVAEIREYQGLQLRFIPGNENPADLATRGISSTQLEHSQWFHGPSWFIKEVKDWPVWKLPTQNQETTETKVTVSAIQIQQLNSKTVIQGPFGIEIKRFSSLTKLLRVTALCQKFVNISKKIENSGEAITAEELQNAKLQWLKYVQSIHYHKEKCLLEQKKSSQLIKQMDLFLDNGLIRCGGRLANAPISQDAKYPVLLPKVDDYTKLIIMDAHRKCFHLKSRSTLVKIRQQYWIPAGLSVVRRVLMDCLPCRKIDGGTFKPPKMGQLPPERLSEAPAWKYTALDYIGPMHTRFPGKESNFEKRWIAIFTCFSTRAVHLEVVRDCSNDAVIRAIERFIARRGTPKILLSDNQSSFVSASKTLKLIFDKQCQADEFTAFFAKEGIQWKTIPERSPWFNGLTERLVGIVKRALKKTLWRACIGEEELQTLITKIEGVLNTRPLLSNSSDIGDQVLTPAHFVAPGCQLGLPPSEDFNDPDWTPNPKVEKDLLGVYSKNQKKLEGFWKIFSTQYLQELREAHRVNFKKKQGEVQRVPKVGEICLVQETGPRLHWPLVCITELLSSPDDQQIRYVRVRLPSGIITRRGVKDLIPLELTVEESTASAENSPTTKRKVVSKTSPATTSSSLNQKPTLRQTRKLNYSLPMAIVLALVTVFIPQGCLAKRKPDMQPYEGNYQICLNGPGGRVLHLPEKQKCVYPTHQESKKIPVVLYVPSHYLPNSTAYLCYMESIRVCTYTSIVFGKGLVDPGSVTKKSVTIEECKIAGTERIFNNINLVQNEVIPNLYTTNKKVEVRYQWWSTQCSTADNFIVEVGQVASTDGRTISTNLISTEKCILEEGYCISQESTLVWSLRSILGFCPFVRKGIYEASVIKDEFVTIPDIQASFQLTKKRGAAIHSCLPETTYLTKDGASVIALGSHPKHKATAMADLKANEYQTSEFEHFRKSLSDIRNADPVNAKLNYLVKKLAEKWQKQLNKECYQLCILAEKEMDILRQFIHIDPTRGVRAVLGRNDVSAEFKNGLLFVHQCQSVKIDKFFWDYKDPNTKKCFEFLPVQVGRRIWFIVGGSSDLVLDSPEIPCQHTHPATLPISENNIIHIKNAFTLSQEKWKFPIFSAPALFKARLVLPPDALRSFAGRAMGTERRLQATINYTSHISTNPNMIRETLIGIGEMGGQLIVSAGNAIGHVIHESMDGLGSLIEHILNPFVIIALIVAVSVIFLILLSIGTFKLYSAHQFRQRVKNAKKVLVDTVADSESPSTSGSPICPVPGENVMTAHEKD